MGLVYNANYKMWFGESTDDIPSNLMKGDLAYFFDTDKNVRYNGTTFVDYIVNTDTTLEVGDIEIGAVEIKNSTDDTRATVGSNGLYVDVQNIKANTTLIQGNVTLTGVAQQLSSASCKNVTIQAEPLNTDYVYVGIANTVSSTVHMYTLAAGASATFTVNNANLLWVIGTSGNKVCYGGES